MGYDTAIQNTRRGDWCTANAHNRICMKIDAAHLKIWYSRLIFREKQFPTLTQKMRERGRVRKIRSAENPVRMRAQGPGPVGSAENIKSSEEKWNIRGVGVNKYCCVIICVYGPASKSDQRKQFYYGSFYRALSCCQNLFLGQRLFEAAQARPAEGRWRLNGFLVANRDLWD